MALDAVFRDHWGRVLATLTGILGDIELAEEAAAEAFAAAAERWPRDGEPANPVGWLVTTARTACPAQIPAELAGLLLAQTDRLLAAADIGIGVAHCEWIVSDGVLYLVECAGRGFPVISCPSRSRTRDFDLLGACAALMRVLSRSARLRRRMPV